MVIKRKGAQHEKVCSNEEKTISRIAFPFSCLSLVVRNLCAHMPKSCQCRGSKGEQGAELMLCSNSCLLLQQLLPYLTPYPLPLCAFDAREKIAKLSHMSPGWLLHEMKSRRSIPFYFAASVYLCSYHFLSATNAMSFLFPCHGDAVKNPSLTSN